MKNYQTIKIRNVFNVTVLMMYSIGIIITCVCVCVYAKHSLRYLTYHLTEAGSLQARHYQAIWIRAD